MGKILDITGEKYGRLTVISFAGLLNKRTASWLCRCECGNEKVIRSNDLRNNQTKSCGCLNLEKLKENIKKAQESTKLPYGEASFNKLFYNYKNSAKSRNLVFALEKDEFKNLTNQKCFYCGTEPKQRTESRANGIYVYNGVDRIDNTQGYITGNVVTCCYICNHMKHILSQQDFIDHIEKIFLNNPFQRIRV